MVNNKEYFWILTQCKYCFVQQKNNIAAVGLMNVQILDRASRCPQANCSKVLHYTSVPEGRWVKNPCWGWDVCREVSEVLGIFSALFTALCRRLHSIAAVQHGDAARMLSTVHLWSNQTSSESTAVVVLSWPSGWCLKSSWDPYWLGTQGIQIKTKLLQNTSEQLFFQSSRGMLM